MVRSNEYKNKSLILADKPAATFGVELSHEPFFELSDHLFVPGPVS